MMPRVSMAQRYSSPTVTCFAAMDGILVHTSGLGRWLGYLHLVPVASSIQSTAADLR